MKAVIIGVVSTLIVAMLAAIIVLSIGLVRARSDQCLPSVTTASGTHAPKEGFCSGDLIFEENFDTLDLATWKHEMSMWGGGNNEFQ